MATDDPRIVRTPSWVSEGECVMTSPLHTSGTDRVAEVASELDVELIVNVQGDEPFIDPQAIDQAVAACKESKGEAIASLTPSHYIRRGSCGIPTWSRSSPTRRGQALYFSRWPIPFVATTRT